jgi:hypothetical protein
METPAILHQRRQCHLRRVIVIPTLIAGLAGFLASYLLSPKYTSRSLVVVQPANGEVWASPPFEDNRLGVLEILEQQVLARNEVLAILEGMGVGKPEMEGSLNTIRENTRIESVADNHAESSGKIVRFNIIYTDSSFQRAQQVCNGLTSRLLEDSRAQQRNLQRRVEDAANGHPVLAQREMEKRRSPLV